MIFHQADYDEGRKEGLACLKIIAGAMEIECADISISEMDELTTRILEKYMKIDPDDARRWRAAARLFGGQLGDPQ